MIISRGIIINIVLLLVIILLILLVIYEPGLEKLQELPKMTDLSEEQVNFIRIEKSNESTIELRKEQDNHWVMTTPLNLPANEFRVENLLHVLATRQYELLDDSNLSLAEVKLSPPAVKLTLNQFVIDFGDKSPLNNGQRYVRANGKVYLMIDMVYHFLVDDAVVFASLSPLGENQKITEIQTPAYHLQLQEGQWIASQPIADNVDTSADALNLFIEDWQTLQALSVKRYTETATDESIIIHLQGQTTPLQFRILATEPNFILALPEKGVQYQFIPSQMKKLLQLPT